VLALRRELAAWFDLEDVRVPAASRSEASDDHIWSEQTTRTVSAGRPWPRPCVSFPVFT